MIAERIAQFVKKQGFSVSFCGKSIGASSGVIRHAISKNTHIQSKWLTVISENYPEINSSWLLTGKGSMLNPTYSFDQKINKAQEKASFYEVSIPFVPKTDIIDFGDSEFLNNDLLIKNHFVIPVFNNKKIDFMIEIEGSTMLPEFKAGDVVACSIVDDNFIQWNQPHVVATKSQGILFKRINQSTDSDYLTMVSENEKYAPFEVPKSQINSIALVVGLVRLI